MMAERSVAQLPWLPMAVRFWRRRSVRIAGLPIVLAVLFTTWLAHGVLRLAAQGLFAALVILESGSSIAELVLDLRAYPPDHRERLPWLRYIEVITGALISLSVGYCLLAIVYPTLRSIPLFVVALVLLAGVAALALAGAVLLVLLLAVVLLYIPVLIVRWRYREWRRSYRYPTRR